MTLPNRARLKSLTEFYSALFHRHQARPWKPQTTELLGAAVNYSVLEFSHLRDSFLERYKLNIKTYQILLSLSHFPDGFPRKWMAGVLNCGDKSVSQELTKLELRQWVRSEPFEDLRNQKLFFITPKGRKALKPAKAALERLQATLFDFAEAQRVTLVDLLTEFLLNMQLVQKHSKFPRKPDSTQDATYTGESDSRLERLMEMYPGKKAAARILQREQRAD